MLELTQEQVRALVQDETQPTTLIDPGTQTTYVLLRRDEYERLVEKSDDDAWSDEEMDLLAVEAGELLDSFGKDV